MPCLCGAAVVYWSVHVPLVMDEVHGLWIRLEYFMKISFGNWDLVSEHLLGLLPCFFSTFVSRGCTLGTLAVILILLPRRRPEDGIGDFCESSFLDHGDAVSELVCSSLVFSRFFNVFYHQVKLFPFLSGFVDSYLYFLL